MFLGKGTTHVLLSLAIYLSGQAIPICSFYFV